MSEVKGLSVAFVEGHPAESARVLENLPPRDSAEFLAAVISRLAAPVLRHLAPAYCAKVLEQLDDEVFVRLLETMGFQEVSQLLHRVPVERQSRLLGRLPVATAVAVRLLIGYPKGTCGAAMDPSPLVLSPEVTVAEALEQLRQFEGGMGDCLFVCDSQRRLVGVIGLGELVRAAPRTAVGNVMAAPQHSLSALTSVASTARHPGWNYFHVLPVVERENRLVGAAHRHMLSSQRSEATAQTAAPLTSGAAGAYWQTISVLTEGVVRALPPVAPVGRAGRDDER